VEGANRMESCHEGIGETDLGNHGGDVVEGGGGRGVRGYHCGVIVVTGQKSFSECFFFLQFLLLLSYGNWIVIKASSLNSIKH